MTGFADKLEAAGLLVTVEGSAEGAPAVAVTLWRSGIGAVLLDARTAAGGESIARVAAACPGLLVGALVETATQGRKATGYGAVFVAVDSVESAAECASLDLPALPLCRSLAELVHAAVLGLTIVRLAPSLATGGAGALPESPPALQFITTGILPDAAGPLLAHPQVIACECPRPFAADAAPGELSAACRAAFQALLGLTFSHVGVNIGTPEQAAAAANRLAGLFALPAADGRDSIYAGSSIELMKERGPGHCGHIGIRSNSIRCASAWLEKQGHRFRWDSAKYAGDRLIVLYLEREIAGFAYHLVQRS